MALRAARDSLPDLAKVKCQKKFTQPQLIACLVIKEFLQLDYRGTHVMLTEWSDLRRVIGRIRGVRYEWRFLKQVNRKGLPLPIKELSETFIGKEALICSTNLSSKS